MFHQVIIAELLSLATIVAYIICSLFWKSTSAAYESLDSNTEDEGEDEVTNKEQFKVIYLNFRLQAIIKRRTGQLPPATTAPIEWGRQAAPRGGRIGSPSLRILEQAMLLQGIYNVKTAFCTPLYVSRRSMAYGSGSLGSPLAGLSQLGSSAGRTRGGERGSLLP